MSAGEYRYNPRVQLRADNSGEEGRGVYGP